MNLLCADYKSLAGRVKKNNSRIVIYGAGMIGTVIIPYLVDAYNLSDNVLFFIDGDRNKQRRFITVGNRKIVVESPDKLLNLPPNTVVFITNSNYSPIVQMLDEIPQMEKVDGYIIPILQIYNAKKADGKYDVRIFENPVIPKKIHYCWFSGKPMPDYLKKCVESWYKYCPDYEIIRWDESNYDVEKNLYMKQAYEAGKWGFVPDIARLDILYEYGGIYLDTDVELLRNLDDLLYQSAFTGVEKWGNVNMGGCSGAIPHHPIIKRMLDYRIDESFLLEDGNLNQTTCGYYETMPLVELGMKPDNTIQKINDMMIYSSEFFHPYDYMSNKTDITDNTFSVHHFNGGWLDEKNMEERRKTSKLYQKTLKRMRVIARN